MAETEDQESKVFAAFGLRLKTPDEVRLYADLLVAQERFHLARGAMIEARSRLHEAQLAIDADKMFAVAGTKAQMLLEPTKAPARSLSEIVWRSARAIFVGRKEPM